jgi:hypothetical protein
MIGLRGNKSFLTIGGSKTTNTTVMLYVALLDAESGEL